MAISNSITCTNSTNGTATISGTISNINSNYYTTTATTTTGSSYYDYITTVPYSNAYKL